MTKLHFFAVSFLLAFFAVEARQRFPRNLLNTLRSPWTHKDTSLDAILAAGSIPSSVNPNSPAMDSVSWEAGFNAPPQGTPITPEVTVETTGLDPVEAARYQIYEQWVFHGTLIILGILLGSVFRDQALFVIDYARASYGEDIISTLFMVIYGLTFLEPLFIMILGKHSKTLRDVELFLLDALVAVYHVLFPFGSAIALAVEVPLLTGIFSYMKSNYRFNKKAVNYVAATAVLGCSVAALFVTFFEKTVSIVTSTNVLLGCIAVMLTAAIANTMHELVRGTSAFSETSETAVPSLYQKKPGLVESFLEPSIGLLHLVLIALISKFKNPF